MWSWTLTLLGIFPYRQSTFNNGSCESRSNKELPFCNEPKRPVYLSVLCWTAYASNAVCRRYIWERNCKYYVKFWCWSQIKMKNVLFFLISIGNIRTRKFADVAKLKLLPNEIICLRLPSAYSLIMKRCSSKWFLSLVSDDRILIVIGHEFHQFKFLRLDDDMP